MVLRNEVLVGALALGLVGCSPQRDPSVVLDSEHAPSRLVENGIAYDRAIVSAGSAKTVVLPDTAVVRRTTETGSVRLFTAKRLGFGGHPPEQISIRDARKRMGCAVRTEGDSLVVATFGEWDSGIEGGARMKLVAVVPEGLAVEQREGLAGKPIGTQGRAWSRSAPPADGWSAVPDEPDTDRTAQ
jgi:hypothetical protein